MIWRRTLRRLWTFRRPCLFWRKNHSAGMKAPAGISQSGGKRCLHFMGEGSRKASRVLHIKRFHSPDYRIFSSKGSSTPRGENTVLARALAALECVS